jgi:alpha-galactosidase
MSRERHFFPIVVLLTLWCHPARGGEFARVERQTLWLDNGAIRRGVVVAPDGTVSTLSLRIPDCPANFIRLAGEEPVPSQPPTSPGEKIDPQKGPNPAEFSFRANDRLYSGKQAWEFLGIDASAREGAGTGATLSLRTKDGPARNLRVELTYILYPGLPLIRKKLRLVNDGPVAIKLESVEVESLTPQLDQTNCAIYRNYARYKHIGPYTGNWDDPVVLCYDQISQRGLALGNEAPGVMKNTTAYLDGSTVTAGLTHVNDAHPFRKWLAVGESWESPWTFIVAYAGADAFAPLASTVPDYVRKYLGLRLTQISSRPSFVYNTWYPFRTDLNEKLIEEVADAAAECGIEEFVIDDGWQNNYGDWEIDRTKFPHGLKPVFDHIKSKGMKPGLWISLATVMRNSRVFQEHPEWLVRDANNQPLNLHSAAPWAAACMTTGWKDHIKGVILGLVREYGLEYVKLDLSIVTSAYIFDQALSGCYATDHPHRDRAESRLEIYRRTWQLFDELHAAAPNLFIDCTFETMGALQLIDLDMCKHAEGNWLANFEEDPPYGSLRVRQMAWWRSSTIPATALVIGNQRLDAPQALLSLQSLAGSLPIMLGDPRRLDAAQRTVFRQWAGWLRAMDHAHQTTLFRQDLEGFGEPAEKGWDGFQRINTETHSGGIVGVFRNAAREDQRQVFVTGLDGQRIYSIRRAPDGEVLTTMNGKELSEKGFPVQLREQHSAALFEINMK